MNRDDLELLKREAGKSQATQLKEFLIDFEKRQRYSSTLSLVFTIIGAAASVIAAVTGLVLLFQ